MSRFAHFNKSIILEDVQKFLDQQKMLRQVHLAEEPKVKEFNFIGRNIIHSTNYLFPLLFFALPTYFSQICKILGYL